MPISWKASFEDPLAAAIQSGAVGNSSQLVDMIVQLYDVTIKTGLIGVKGAPPGPILGNPLALKSQLTSFYTSTASINQVKAAKTYAAAVAAILVKSKAIYAKINVLLRLKTATISSITSMSVLLSKLEATNTTESKVQAASVRTELSKLQATKLSLIAEIEANKSIIVNDIRPAAAALKSTAASTVKAIAIPALQSTAILSKSKIPQMVKAIKSDIAAKRKKQLVLIKESIKQTRNQVNSIKSIISLLPTSDRVIASAAIATALSSMDMTVVTNKLSTVVNLVAKQGPEIIALQQQNTIRSAAAAIVGYKQTILASRALLTGSLAAIATVRAKEIIETFTPKLVSGTSVITDKKADAKELKLAISEYRQSIKQAVATALLVRQLYLEMGKLNALSISQYIPNSNLASLLSKDFAEWASIYKTIDTKEAAIVFLTSALTFASAKKKMQFDSMGVLKSNISGIKSKIASKKINIESIKFNNALRLGLIGYWANAPVPTVAPNTAVVLNPGQLIKRVNMLPSSNPNDFIVDLSQAMQAHLSTVSGQYIIPGSPPVVIPWVGYN